MRRPVVTSVIILVLLAPATAVLGQQLGVPPGRWWERPRIAQELSLTAEQRQKLNEQTVGHARAMVDLKAAVEHAELELRVAAEAETFSAKEVRTAFAALQHARNVLEAERFEMLVKVREIVTPAQWLRLQQLARVLTPKLQEERRERVLQPGNQQRPIRRRQ
jgi:Spy/CpxP family protein refolding chaperone